MDTKEDAVGSHKALECESMLSLSAVVVCCLVLASPQLDHGVPVKTTSKYETREEAIATSSDLDGGSHPCVTVSTSPLFFTKRITPGW